MATVVNNPAPESNNGNMIVTLLLVIVLAVLFYVYGLPAINNARAPQINVPSKIDVNVHQQQ